MNGKKIKIAHVIYGLKYGGAEKLLIPFTTQLNKERYEAIVIALYFGGPVEEELKKSGIPVFTIRRDARFGFFDFLKLMKILEGEKVSLVHTHLLLADFWGGLSARVLGLPQVSTCHRAYEYPSWLLFYKRMVSYLFPARIIAVSKSTREELLRRYPIASHKVVTVYNGINTSVTVHDKMRTRKELGFSEGDFIIINVARLDPEKGHLFLIRAIRSLVKDIPSLKALIIGDGSLRETFARTIRDKGLESVIFLMGPRNDVDKFYCIGDLFILPSLKEGFPLTVLEAMLYGLPVAASAVDGVKEIVAEGVNGSLFAPSRVDEIKGAIQRAFTDRKKLFAMAESAQALVREKFSQTEMMRNLEKIYEQISNGPYTQ